MLQYVKLTIAWASDIMMFTNQNSSYHKFVETPKHKLPYNDVATVPVICDEMWQDAISYHRLYFVNTTWAYHWTGRYSQISTSQMWNTLDDPSWLILDFTSQMWNILEWYFMAHCRFGIPDVEHIRISVHGSFWLLLQTCHVCYPIVWAIKCRHQHFFTLKLSNSQSNLYIYAATYHQFAISVVRPWGCGGVHVIRYCVCSSQCVEHVGLSITTDSLTTSVHWLAVL